MARLFIYIPTFNRPEALRQQLSVLAPQVLLHQSEVRVVISDNASSNDEQIQLLSEYQGTPNIEVRSNCGNIGGNGNIALGFAFAKPTEFLWILSDNDIIREDAVGYILDQLDAGIDFYCFVEDEDRAKDVVHTWQEGWQIPMEWRMGLISDGLYNMECVSKSIEKAFYYHNSSFPHLAVACAAAKEKSSITFRLIPRKYISRIEASSEEQPTDYSLAYVGMPLLIPLFPSWEARSFSRNWALRHGIDFHINRRNHPHVYIHTKAIIKHYGGLIANIIIWLSSMAAFVASPYIMHESSIKKFLKSKLSSKSYNQLKHIRSILCEN